MCTHTHARTHTHTHTQICCEQWVHWVDVVHHNPVPSNPILPQSRRSLWRGQVFSSYMLKGPYIPSKEPCIPSQKSPTFPQKSPIFPHKGPTLLHVAVTLGLFPLPALFHLVLLILNPPSESCHIQPSHGEGDYLYQMRAQRIASITNTLTSCGCPQK